MTPAIRKLCVFEEKLLIEAGPLETPFHQVAAAATFTNPWLERGYVTDLSPEIEAYAPHLGELLAEECVKRLGGPQNVACIGKAGFVGLAGEIEHANVLIHTRLFGDEVRRASKGELWMVGGQKRGVAGATLEVPVAHKSVDRDQTSYWSIEIRVPDAPLPDEILVAVAMTNSVRPRARTYKR